MEQHVLINGVTTGFAIISTITVEMPQRAFFQEKYILYRANIATKPIK